jgi:glyoxylase-like metal-dependent hydrolase (beta-lactamase superfamily II)
MNDARRWVGGLWAQISKGLATAAASLMLVAPSMAQQDFGKVEFKSVPVIEGLVMLQGAGGNIGVSKGRDGLLVIDNDYAALENKLRGALLQHDHRPARFLLNTHWHGDHTGNNASLGREQGVIVAHDNVRSRLASGGEIKAFGMKIPPAERVALPAVTYDKTMTLHWNRHRLELVHPDPAHTDGDTVVYFYRGDKLEAVHTGDLFFNGIYPFIDASSGGSAMGMVAAVADVLSRIDDKTPIIPGHGPLAHKKDLQRYHDFLNTAVSRIAALKSQGKSLQQVINAKPISDFEAEWGDGFLNTQTWVGIVYGAL